MIIPEDIKHMTPDQIKALPADDRKELAREFTRRYFKESPDPADRSHDVDKALDSVPANEDWTDYSNH